MSDALAAADPKRSAWVSANAGAGKTHTLANRVTRLLLEGARPEKILCLTYTKAAAAEMAGRLFEQLGEWSMLSDADLTQRIAEIGEAPRDKDGLKAARRLFAKALETPGGLKIQTIHSFCQYLLARFPLEAGIAPSFRVLDDATARELLAEARSRVLERAGSGDVALSAAAAHLVTQTSEARLKQILDAALGNDRRKLERFFGGLAGDDALAKAVAGAHGAEYGETAESIAAAFLAEMEAEEARLIQVVQWLATGKKTDIERADALRSALEGNGDSFEDFAGVFLTTKREPLKSLATKALADAQPALLEYLQGVMARFIAAEERARAARAASLAHAALTLADAARHEYAREKHLRGALDYDDLIIETQRLLEKKEAAAWVLYKLDGGLDHILIDEAQDTSPEQWAIVRRLTEEFVAGSGARDDTVRTIFVVGDEKQSIFSFQGADPSEFERNRLDFAARSGPAASQFEPIALTKSWRSAPEILQFVDEVFGTDEARAGLTFSGAMVSHDAHRDTAKGRVEFWPALKPAEAPEPDPWRPVDVESEASPVVRLAERIATQIRSWIDSGAKLPGHDNPIHPGDIMILMPRREPFASEIIRRLKERGVPVAGADRIKLGNQIAVMDLIALGRFALLPEDDLNLAALLRSPMIDVSEEELFALCNGREGTLWRALSARKDECAAFGFAHAFLSEMLSRADFTAPYEFYATALSTFGMRSRLLARLTAEAADAIDEFLSLALNYEALNTPSLEGFLHWIARGDAEIKRDMERGRDEVRVMTVHGAKGLEADIVILPDTTSLPDSPGKRGDLLYTDDGVVFPLAGSHAPDAVKRAKADAEIEALKEHRRLLYVALTRAKDRLYVCGFESKKGVREGSWYEHIERAAMSLGVPVVRGDETVHLLGEADVERAGAVAPAPTPKFDLPGWATKALPAERETPRLIRPSDAAGMDEPAMLSPLGATKRFARGLLVHALLARLPEIEPALRRDIALKFLTARAGAQQAREIADETLRVLNDPAFAAAFAPGSRAELAIVADLPELGEGARISGRIDRLAVTDTEVLAVDFKTNRPPPARPQDVSTLYLTQMALYRAALAKVFPKLRIATALVWTEGPSLMALPDALLDAETARIRARPPVWRI